MKAYRQIFNERIGKQIDACILILDISVEKAALLFGIQFELTEDELDINYAAGIELSSGDRFILRNYHRGPYPKKIEIHAEREAVNYFELVEKLISELNISEDSIFWRVKK
jgi:hypothetical protein